MREIKFRAYINGSGKPRMIKWDDIDAIEWCNDKLWYKTGKYTLLGNLTLLQYTGLKDKNGEDIYEGDILRIHDADKDDGMGERYDYCTVEFQNGAFKVEYNFGDYDMSAIGWAIDIWRMSDITCEVIGNFYENPELMTGRHEA